MWQEEKNVIPGHLGKTPYEHAFHKRVHDDVMSKISKLRMGEDADSSEMDKLLDEESADVEIAGRSFFLVGSDCEDDWDLEESVAKEEQESQQVWLRI